MRKKRIICLYGGPGAGKSTTCAGLFYKLKLMGLNCEMNREYVKEWIWEGRQPREGDQSYFFSQQARKERIYIKKGMDFIITDSPLLLTHYYGGKYDAFERKYGTNKSMLEAHHGFCKDHDYKVEHFFIKRSKNYDEEGRYEDEQTARMYDQEIRTMLSDFGIRYHEINAYEEAVDQIIDILRTKG